MIPAPFEYVRADSVDEALAALAEHGDEAKVLAGGHSLLPLMKLRLATPSVLVDVGRLDELAGIRVEDGTVVVGALVRHRRLETDPIIAEHVPLLARAASHVGDPQVRHRGTLGGALAHGDPASDLPAAVLALGGSLVVRGPAGRREIPADDFFVSFLETAVGPDELLEEVRLPSAAGAGWSFQKLSRRAQDWAIVGTAVVVGAGRVGVGLVNMDHRPVRAEAVEAALGSGEGAEAAAALAAEGREPPEDQQASAAFRRHLARVLVRRALEQAGR